MKQKKPKTTNLLENKGKMALQYLFEMKRKNKACADVDQHITESCRLEKPCKIKPNHKPSIAKPPTKPLPSATSTHPLNPPSLLFSSCCSFWEGAWGLQSPLKPPLYKIQTYSSGAEALSHDKHPTIPTKIRAGTHSGALSWDDRPGQAELVPSVTSHPQLPAGPDVRIIFFIPIFTILGEMGIWKLQWLRLNFWTSLWHFHQRCPFCGCRGPC